MDYCREQVYLYFYNELESNTEFLAHLSECSFCQDRLLFLEKMSQSMDFDFVPQSQAILGREKISKWVLVAAILLLGFFALFSFVKKTPEKIQQNLVAKKIGWDDLDTDIDKLRNEIKRFSQRSYKISIYKTRCSKIKRKIAKLKHTKIW